VPKRILAAADLTVGDEVFCRSGRYDHNSFFAKVSKITPKGQIVVERNIIGVDNQPTKKEYRFSKNGDEIGADRWDQRHLVNAAYARVMLEMHATRKLANRSLAAVRMLETPRGDWDAETLLKVADDLENKLIEAKAAIIAAKKDEDSFTKIQQEYT